MFFGIYFKKEMLTTKMGIRNVFGPYRLIMMHTKQKIKNLAFLMPVFMVLFSEMEQTTNI